MAAAPASTTTPHVIVGLCCAVAAAAAWHSAEATQARALYAPVVVKPVSGSTTQLAGTATLPARETEIQMGKSKCVHPDRPTSKLCNDCPRRGGRGALTEAPEGQTVARPQPAGTPEQPNPLATALLSAVVATASAVATYLGLGRRSQPPAARE
eukprot:EG_transcript_39981